MSINVGDVLSDDIRIDAKVGEGGFGVVYRAHQISLDGPVAVKALLIDNVADPEEALADFRAEASAIRKLAHPQIPAVYTMGMHDGTPYIVMEWLEGRTLRERLEQEGPLSEAAALRIVEQLAKPLALAHAQGLVHRDLKPANVFELPDGSVKLIDFGLAKYFGAAAQRGKRKPTESGVLKGTFWFMSPEAACGKPLDARADVYSLGAVLYSLLTGRLPFGDRFGGDNQLIPLVTAIAMGERPADVRTLRPVRNDVADLVLQLMAVDPNARFQSMAEVERVARAILLDPDRPLSASATDKTVARLTAKEVPTRVTQSGSQRAPSKRLRVALVVGGLVAFGLSSAFVGALIAGRRSSAPPSATSVPTTATAAPAVQPAPVPVAPAPAAAPAPELSNTPSARALETKKLRKKKPPKSAEPGQKNTPAPDSDEPRFGGR